MEKLQSELFRSQEVSKLLPSLRFAILHFDDDKRRRIWYLIEEFLAERPDMNPELVEALRTIVQAANPSETQEWSRLPDWKTFFSSHTSVTESCKDSFASHSSQAKTAICNYLDAYLACKRPPNLFQRSTWGATAATFLPIASFPWVMKWESRLEAEAEYVCTQLFSRAFTSLSVPMTFLDVEAITSRETRYVKSRKVEGVALGSQIPLVVEFLDGSNFKEVCKRLGPVLPALSDEEIGKVCAVFGEIAGYDYLIGNTDRLIPVELSNPNHKANGGNLQLELDENSHFLSCHVIDNAPFFNAFYSLREKKQSRPVEDDDCTVSFLFGGADEEEEAEATAEATGPTGEELRGKLAEGFNFFIEEKDSSLIASVIAQGLKRECQHMLPDKAEDIARAFEGYRTRIEEGILQGLAVARNKLKEPACMKVLQQIAQERDFLPTTALLLDFIRNNLLAAQRARG